MPSSQVCETSAMKKASVIITTKNRREDLLKAVESAIAQRALLEVIVIDDGSTDGTEAAVSEMLKKDLTTESTENTEEQAGLRFTGQAGAAFSNPSTSEHAWDPENTLRNRSAIGPAPLPVTSYSSPATAPQLRLIRHEVSAGYIVRRNEGARVARGDVIFSLDDDAVFSSAFVVEQTLRDFSHPRIGAVAIPYIEPHKANKEMQRAPTREDVWITASYIGTAHAVRRDVFLALGGYREHLVHQGEEGDFCLRMLAAGAEHSGDRRWKIEDREAAKPPMADREGRMADSANGAKALAPGPSTLDSAPLPAVPGFFVRLGNSDLIIHNESPKRDYSRMDFYGRRNDVLFHWQNTPMPDLLWQLPMTIVGGLLCAYRVKRWRKMLEGIVAGFVAIASGEERKPVSMTIAGEFKLLKQAKRKLSI